MAVTILSRAVLAAISLLSFWEIGAATELVYPSGHDITVQYSLNRTSLLSSDTLVVRRTLVNHTTFVLRSLYFSDNLPPNFQLIHHAAVRNQIAVTSVLTTDRDDPAVVGQVGYYWVFDNPDTTVRSEVEVNPGDSITLLALFVCRLPGEYQLPLHTTVFYGDGQGGFFATSGQSKVTVTVATDVGDDENLPGTYLTSVAYPNPFNGVVTIQYAGARLGDTPLELVIYNMLGQQIHEDQVLPNDEEGSLSWYVGSAVASGVYYYRLYSGGRVSGGKLMLLK